MKRLLIFALLLVNGAFIASAQTNKGLDKYDFFYTGENFNNRYMFIVKDGHVVWRYHETENEGNDQNGIPGEISDAVWMNDNHILVAAQYQIFELAIDTVNWKSTVVWRHSWTRPDYEVHSAMPIGRKYVAYIQCANSPSGNDRFQPNQYKTKLIVRDIATWSVVRELDIPYSNCNRHNLNRSNTITPWGTFIFASMEKDRAYEIDSRGNIVNEIYQDGLWGVEVCPGPGRRLILSSEGSSEVSVYDLNQNNKKIWTYKWRDDQTTRNNPAYIGNKTGNFNLSVQKAVMLEDGTVVMSNWGGWNPGDGDDYDAQHQPIQCRAVDQQKNVTWELQSWNGSDFLGPSTIFQLLREPVDRDALYFGDLRGDLDESNAFYLYNVGQEKYVHTGGYFKTPDMPELVETKEQATKFVITPQEEPAYLIADPDWPAGWAVQGRQVISISMGGTEKMANWGTTLTPGWTFMSSSENHLPGEPVYVCYTWGDYAPGNYAVDDPSGKTYALYYGNYEQATDQWNRTARNDVKAEGIYGGLFSTIGQYGDNASWQVIPLKNGTIDVVPFNLSAIRDVRPSSMSARRYYNMLGQPVDRPNHGIYIVNGNKIIK